MDLMTKAGYRGLSLPMGLTDEIDNIINTGYGGYSCRTEFIKEACRDKIDKIKQNNGGIFQKTTSVRTGCGEDRKEDVVPPKQNAGVRSGGEERSNTRQQLDDPENTSDHP